MHTQHILPHIMIVNRLEANKERFRPEGFDQIRPHSIRSLQFNQKIRTLSFRPEKLDLFTATQTGTNQRHVLSIPTLLVSLFFFNSTILQTGILQTGPNQFVEYSLYKNNLRTGPYFSTNWIQQTGFLQIGSLTTFSFR